MTQTIQHRTAAVVPLTETINIRTHISPEHLPALRAGFALCPANPRWNIFKFRAWRVGRQWRYAMQAGEMEICPTSRLLVMADNQHNREEEDSDRQFLPKNAIVRLKPVAG